MKLLGLVAVPLALIATVSVAQDYDAAMKDYLDGSIRTWANDPVLVEAITAANAERAGFDQAKIDSMDAAWRAEVGQSDSPTITPALTSAAADFLRAQVEASGGKITEVFITDNLGLNVAVSAPTSDMWQGDEEKFTSVFPAGPDGVLFGEIELDESTQTYQGQISISITDPASAQVIGTMTIGVNAEALM
ncbi:hypothetical protein [Tabrizicola sp. TH137]|uniref:hypothetical protein n=1 Tax=Tabrizicola sp. TH137 TaxID=2067452 RepID=UPI00156D80D4|nr:hypothetical protein [Tabrizicola sp. TH137]